MRRNMKLVENSRTTDTTLCWMGNPQLLYLDPMFEDVTVTPRSTWLSRPKWKLKDSKHTRRKDKKAGLKP